MGNRVSPELSRLLSERKITRAQISRDMILKEIEAAETDLKDAKDSFENDKFKWQRYRAIIQCFTALELYSLARVTGRRAITLCCWR